MKKILLFTACAITIMVMTILMYPKLQENSRQSWIDKWDGQME